MSRLPLLMVVLLATACASPPSQERIPLTLEATVQAANDRFGQGLIPEASVLLHAAERVDAEHPGVAELRARIGPDKQGYVTRGKLGINRRARVRVQRNFLVRLLLYPVDRVLDALDMVTVDAHVGIGALANVHVTRAVQAGAGLRSKMGLGLHNPRSIGAQLEVEAGVTALALGTEALSGATFGLPRGVTTGSDTLTGLHRPSSPIYQEYRDYYAVGAQVTAGLVGVDVDLHPVQLFDLLAGFFLVDFARDDYSITRGLDLGSYELGLLRQLNDFERSHVRERRRSGER